MKKMLAIAVAAALAAPAAMADTTLYGKLHESYGKVKQTNIGGVAGNNSNNSGLESHASRIGVKGSTALDNGMEATYGIEFGLNLDGDNGGATSLGNTSTVGNSLSSRNQWVGLKGNFGEIRAGRHDTPSKLATAGQDVFADTYADMNNIIFADNLRVNNAVAYINKFGPVGFAYAHSSGATNDFDPDADSAMVNYSNGPWYAGLGYTHMRKVAGTAGTNGNQANLGLGWKAEAGHEVNVVLESVKATNTGVKTKNALINGVYRIGNVGLKAEYGQSNPDGAPEKAKLGAVGVDYHFGKKTSAYLLHSDFKNSNYAVSGAPQARTKATAVGLVTEF